MARYQFVRVAVEERTAILTIDRPPANAINAQVVGELGAALDGATGNPAVKTIIITGAGGLFTAGADINELAALQGAEEGLALARRGQALLSRIETSAKPVIAAINGHSCLGGGNELALACHIRLAEEGVRLGQPETNLGLIPGWGGTQRLPRYVGRSKALEMILTGNEISAQEAQRLGLVSAVVPAGEVLQAAKGLARRLNAKSAPALAAALRAIAHSSGLPQGYDVEAAEFAQLCTSEDGREGVSAFLGKRPPAFRDW